MATIYIFIFGIYKYVTKKAFDDYTYFSVCRFFFLDNRPLCIEKIYNTLIREE